MDEELVNPNDQDQNIESDVEEDEFFFESDHLALRGNSDYTCVLRTIAILQAQRIQVTKDIDKLATAERIALDDPEEFLKKLQKGELNFPGPISVAELPKINFEKYGVSIPEFVEEEQKTETTDVTVRGRVFDQTKPETFNQLWTYEEQKRLEELLVEYPPEPVEMRRFAKIAKALGNRTTKQVASRLQKYFKKLHSAGMPVPGRIPRSSRTYISKSSRIMKQALRPTTFFPANHVPVFITEDDGDDGGGCVPLSLNWYRKGCMPSQPQNGEASGVGSVSGSNVNGFVVNDRKFIVDDDESDGGGGGGGGGEDGTTGKSNKYPDTDEEKILRLLMRIKRDKNKDGKMERVHCEHNGFKCDLCEEEPIIGTRWHCTICTDTSVDFCSDCLLTQLKIPEKRHSLEHKFVGFRVSSVNEVGSNDGPVSRLQSEDSGSGDDEDDEDGDGDDDGDESDDDNGDDDENDIGTTGFSNINGNAIDDDDEETDRGTSSSSSGRVSTSVATTSASYFDEDYLTNKFTVKQEYNYLDPNFMPN